MRRVTHITWVLGMGMPKTRRCLCHCYTGMILTLSAWGIQCSVHWGQVIQLFDADVSHCADIKRILCILPNAVICSKLEHLSVLYRKPLKSHPLDVTEMMWKLIEKLHHVLKKPNKKKKNRKRMPTGIRLPDVEGRASPPWCYNSPLEKLRGRMVTSFGCSDFWGRLGK